MYLACHAHFLCITLNHVLQILSCLRYLGILKKCRASESANFCRRIIIWVGQERRGLLSKAWMGDAVLMGMQQGGGGLLP